MSRWQNETVESCRHCGKRYVTGCVKGLFICADCQQTEHTTHPALECIKCKELEERAAK